MDIETLVMNATIALVAPLTLPSMLIANGTRPTIVIVVTRATESCHVFSPSRVTWKRFKYQMLCLMRTRRLSRLFTM